MARRRIRLDPVATTAGLPDRFARIRAELGVPSSFPPDVLAEAERAASRPAQPRVDLRDLPFVTVDPTGATDLDQAMCLGRRGAGYSVDYAIADVPFFVPPGGAVAREALRRGQTIYSPDGRTPLHPPVLSEAAASLLPGQARPAFVWRFRLDDAGVVERVELVRATVRSREQLDYEQVQAAADAPGAAAGDGPDGPAQDLAGLVRVLKEVGKRRLLLERRRGGASLPLPEQEVVAGAHGYGVRLRPPVPAEDWNAQLSLMTGMAAASIMLQGGTGILRTLPAPDGRTMARFRRQVRSLGVPWPDGRSYGEFLAGLSPTDPRHLAVLHAAGALFRGASYLPLVGGGASQPDGSLDRREPVDGGEKGSSTETHAAVAAPYAHVTAPLRRLVDRFGLVACHSLQQGDDVPGWVADALPALPAAMAASDRLAGEVERRCVDAVEAAVLGTRPEREWNGVVVDVDPDGDGGRVQLLDPVVLARCSGRLRLGESIRVALAPADPQTRADGGGGGQDAVRFVPAESPAVSAGVPWSRGRAGRAAASGGSPPAEESPDSTGHGGG